MFYHLFLGRDFLVRMQRNSIKEVQDFFKSNDKSKIIEIDKLHDKSSEQLIKKEIKFDSFKIRLVKVILDNGEVEVLATSLLDDKKYLNEEFKDLYFLRWGD